MLLPTTLMKQVVSQTHTKALLEWVIGGMRRGFARLSGAEEGYKGDYDGNIHIPQNVIMKPIIT